MSVTGVVLGCEFEGEWDMNPGPGVDLRQAAGGHDGFLSLFDAELRRVWSWTSGDPRDDVVSALATDGQGHIYVALWIRGEDGSRLLAFTEDGLVIWDRPFPGSVWKMVARPPHGLILTGWFSKAGDFDPGPGEDIHTPNIESPSPYAFDGFVTRLNAEGTY